MNTAQEILKLIETVSLDDSAKLDEIDLRVCYYVHYPEQDYENTKDFFEGLEHHIIKYTRSRDALKAIRPEKWIFRIVPYFDSDKGEFACDAWNGVKWSHSVSVKRMPTEELAELHAIIQAIEWERNNEENT